MRRFKKLVIGGIQSKIFNLILLTVALLTAVFTVVSVYHSNMLSHLAAESGAKQQAGVTEISSSVMEAVVTQTLQRSNKAEAMIADQMFDAVRDRVAFLTERATRVFTHPEDYSPQPYARPKPEQEGVWTAKVIYAGDTDPSDPAVVARLGLAANLSDTMISVCRSMGAVTAYIAFPEGAHLSVSESSNSWFINGQVRSYDPRQRGWYQKAAREGRLIFTEGEYDANTGAYCIECAMPVYGRDGELCAVVGMDLFLDEMERVMYSFAVEGEYQLLINRSGQAVLAPQAEVFPMAQEDRGGDLRQSKIELLSRIVNDAIGGKETGVLLGQLQNGAYYVTATPIETTGWVLLSAYSQEKSDQPTVLLRDSYETIQNETIEAYQGNISKSQATAVVLLLAAMVLMLFGALMLGKKIVKPLNTMTGRIAQLDEENLEFSMDDAYRTGDEVEDLAKSFAELSHKTVEYMETVKRVTAEKERIGAELSIATRIQAAMLPHVFPPFPDRPEFDIFATMDPAKEVGGDFFDYFLVDDDHLCLVMADVSGKGVPAALFMMASKIILANNAMMGKSPAEILTDANAAICSNNQEQMFVTVWLGILEISTGKLTAANAGHEYPVIRHPGGGFELYKDKHGFVIGGMEGVKYRQYELTLEPGASLFLYTDGVPEATSAEKELFGIERMLGALNHQPDAAPRSVLENVRADVDSFVKEAEQFDDLTMLCLAFKGGRERGIG